ncbi:hypothetical protein T440DRAFT_518570 [Plenodomus tracheiphilus IPT5]|uniref:Developmental regulatory protein wetA n=1 Tax=Plenodomus tracheiphilus IPT5 TaxID=1408161 RepID=A0A6A7B449_9PLEO|nr:hypothetical protein T440DRAFT_518570 [Plenodomus tracheiphilus IPT5]
MPLPMRPISDKEMGVVDLDQLFEEYVETDFLQQFSESTADRSSSDDLAHLFELPPSNENELFGTSSSPMLNRDTADAWHKALQKCEQKPTPSVPDISSSFYVQSQGKESLSDSELLSFEDIFELDRNLNQLRSISQPSTPRPHTPRTVKKAVSFNDRATPRGIQKLPKKSASTSFTKMMQPSYYRTPISDVWSRKMDTTADSLQLQAPPNDLNSPPPSSRIIQHENGNGFFAQDHQAFGNNRSPLTSDEPHTPNIDFSNYQLTPQASPALGLSAHSSSAFPDNMGMTYSSSVSSAALSALHTPPSSNRLPMTTWGPDTSPTLEFGFSASPDFCSTKTAGWWDDSTHHPAPNFRETHSRSSNHNMSLSVPMGGLGISCDTAAFGDFGAVGLGVSVGETTMSGAPAPSFDMAGYTAMYTPPQQHIVNIGHRPLSRTPSPTPQPRFHRRRPSGQSHSHHQRASHSSTASSRRKSSNGSSQSSRQASTGGSGFVNFTPDDSRKILTGVAPSGSSKTKARREKEAADKRRKLSQAAMKAVMEAGGDIDSLRRLEREGLLVLES